MWYDRVISRLVALGLIGFVIFGFIIEFSPIAPFILTGVALLVGLVVVVSALVNICRQDVSVADGQSKAAHQPEPLDLAHTRLIDHREKP